MKADSGQWPRSRPAFHDGTIATVFYVLSRRYPALISADGEFQCNFDGGLL